MFAHLHPVLSAIIDFLDIPDLYQITRSPNLLPEGLDAGICKLLTRESFVLDLSKKYRLPVLKSFQRLVEFWSIKHLFAVSTPDWFISKHIHLLPEIRMLRKAAKAQRYAFVDNYIAEHNLYKSEVQMNAICHGCCHDKQRVLHYADLYDDGCDHWDAIEAECLMRAYLKGLPSKGLGSALDLAMEEVIAAQDWQTLRGFIDYSDSDCRQSSLRAIFDCKSEIYGSSLAGEAIKKQTPYPLTEIMTATDQKKLFINQFALRFPDFLPTPNSYYANYLLKYPPQGSTLIPKDIEPFLMLGEIKEGKIEVSFSPRLLFKLDGLYDLLSAKSICSFAEYQSYLESLALPVLQYYCLTDKEGTILYAEDYARRCLKLLSQTK